MRDDRERLYDILEAIEKIEKYAKHGREEFSRNELIQTWMMHNIQILGEAVARLSDEFRLHYQDIPWRQIIAMRNILVHVYFNVEKDEIWNVIERDIPQLKTQILAIIETIE